MPPEHLKIIREIGFIEEPNHQNWWALWFDGGKFNLFYWEKYGCYTLKYNNQDLISEANLGAVLLVMGRQLQVLEWEGGES